MNKLKISDKMVRININKQKIEEKAMTKIGTLILLILQFFLLLSFIKLLFRILISFFIEQLQSKTNDTYIDAYKKIEDKYLLQV